MIGLCKIPPVAPGSARPRHRPIRLPSSQTMAAPISPPRLLPSGDSAITVEFSRKIDDEANRRVLALDRTLASEPIAGVTKPCPPTDRSSSTTIPRKSTLQTLAQKLVELALSGRCRLQRTARLWRIPVAYGGEYGIDLEDVAKTLDTDARRHRRAAHRRRISRRHARVHAGLVLSQRLAGVPAYVAAAKIRVC